jgi:chromosome segregation ATPase
MTKPLLSEDEIDRIQGDAYQALVAAGYSGGMGGSTWDRASARAIESAILAKLAEGVELPEPELFLHDHMYGSESAYSTEQMQALAATLAAVRAVYAEAMESLRIAVDERDAARTELDALKSKHQALSYERDGLLEELAAASNEAQEQARLNGMGSEREAKLIAELERVTAERDELRLLLSKARDEFKGLPRSLGYEFTHLPEIDATLAAMQREG